MIAKLLPLEDFFVKDITPDELAEYLDALEHECSINLLKNNERASDSTIGALYYIHELRKTLEKCH